MTRLALQLLIVCMLLPAVATCDWAREGPGAAPLVLADPEPDTSKAIRLDRWATQEEGDRFHSVVGMRKRAILRRLGHPFRVSRGPGGREVWSYAWGVDWRLHLQQDGVCTSAHSNDGW